MDKRAVIATLAAIGFIAVVVASSQFAPTRVGELTHVPGFKMPEAAVPIDPPKMIDDTAETRTQTLTRETKRLTPQVPPETALAMQTLITLAGYDCQTVDAARPFWTSEGWTVYCNVFRYRFNVSNHGGRWLVEAP